MTREKEISHSIAILATGDEICHGDIINSNSQEIATRLTNLGMEVRMHMTAPDTVPEIEAAIRFLLQSHQALIITGGLGPTSDDLTRFALANVLNKELIFDQASWDCIVERLKRFGYPTPPESNRQQSLFPAGATIIPNPNGTAAGCMIEHNQQFIFMLPGPPPECIPMVDKVAIPTLQKAGFKNIDYHKHWFLFSVSEGKMAEELDSLVKPYNCITGYRLFYPYIEFKVHCNDKADFEKVITLIEKTISPYLIQDGAQTASVALRQRLKEKSEPLFIEDNATAGALESTITSPLARKNLHFGNHPNPTIRIDGLKEYWEEKQETTKSYLQLTINNQTETFEVPFRGKLVLKYAVELICKQLLEFTNATN